MLATLTRLTASIARPRACAALLLLVLLAAGVFSTVRALLTPFWYDEICTVIVSRLPNAVETWKALADAADTNPPPYYSLTRAARQIVPDDHLAYRLPSILGLLGAFAGLYVFLLRRVSPLAALIGATFILCTPLIDYASEARPYALMFFCLSGALVAWQRIDDSRIYSAALAAALAAAVSMHYYAIFAWPAFALAEASFGLSRRRFRAGAWMAVVAGAVPLIAYSGILRNLREAYGQNFWAVPSVTQVVSAHNWLYSLGGHAGWTIAVGLTVLLAYRSLAGPGRTTVESPAEVPGSQAAEPDKAVPLEECLLILGLLWLPVIAVAVAKITHGGMNTRYMMPAALGGALALGYLINRAPVPARAFLLALLLMNYVLSDAKVLVKTWLLDLRATAASELKSILTRHKESGLPIVISSGIRYLPMAYYAPADAGRKLFVLIDPPASVKFAGTDSVDLALPVLRRYFPLQVEDYGRFASMHREFLLVSGSGERFDWWPARLAADGHTLQLLPGVGNTILYKVTLKH